jgi:hypothetical protein
VPRGTVAAAALALGASVGAGWLLDRYLTTVIYPEGTRSLSAEIKTRLHSVHGAVNVVEMAAGQLWRLVLVDRTAILQPRRSGPADRGERGRGGLAARPAGTGQLAARAGRVADRGLESSRRLGRLAQGLTAFAVSFRSAGAPPGYWQAEPLR